MTEANPPAEQQQTLECSKNKGQKSSSGAAEASRGSLFFLAKFTIWLKEISKWLEICDFFSVILSPHFYCF
jgi:hypothetical protein